MKFVLSILIALVCCGAVSAAQTYKPYAIDRYQSILDRMPFGPLPPNFSEDGEPEPAPVMTEEEIKTAEEIRVEQQQLAKGVKVSCVNINPDGEVMVGFTDTDEKPPINFYMAVGDERKGWSIVDADYDKEWAQLKKNDIVITMKLGEGLIDAPAGSKGATMSNTVSVASAAPPAPAAPPQTVRQLSSLQPPAPIPPAGSSFMERMKERAARTERERKEQAALAKQQSEEHTKKLVEMAKQAALQELEKQRQEEELEREQEAQPLPTGVVE
ncbi:MAG: hypothetical protein J6Z49_03625 [Kiritimatiellae bacterium]|nr:hypothetical protein [Kiritimatiellia bacterium]